MNKQAFAQLFAALTLHHSFHALTVFYTLAVLFGWTFGSGSPAFGSPTVAITDTAYRDIDKLAAIDMIEDAHVSQRPWTRMEFARLIIEAETNANVKIADKSRSTSYPIELTETIERLKIQFTDEIQLLENPEQKILYRPIDHATFLFSWLNSHPRAILPDNGMGTIDATLDPMTFYQEGIHFTQGSSLLLQTDHWASYGQLVSFYIQPQYFSSGSNNAFQTPNFSLNRAYGTARLGPFELQVGRDSVVWGYTEHGGTLLSDNAEPLNMIKISTPSPIELPGFLKALGPFRGVVFLSDLGSNRESPHANMWGVNLSFKPSKILEFNLEHTFMIGGAGHPDTGWLDHLEEFFLWRPCNGYCGNRSSHRLGGGWDLRIPGLSYTHWNSELTWGDLGIDSLVADMTYRLAFTTGLYFPIAFSDFNSELRIQYSRVSPLVYRHTTFTSGYQVNEKVLGLAAGNALDEIKIEYRNTLSPSQRITLRGFYEAYDGNHYHQEAETHIILDWTVPTETRFRIETEFAWELTNKITITPRLGYEHVWNFQFVGGQSLNDVVIAVLVNFSKLYGD